MPIAARVNDHHSCPMHDGPKPHLGGPIKAGSPDVLIESLPAARTTDQAQCACPAPDVLAMGCPTVLINHHLAVRVGDMTSHGGVVEAGAGSVEIGLAGDGAAVMPIAKPETPALVRVGTSTPNGSTADPSAPSPSSSAAPADAVAADAAKPPTGVPAAPAERALTDPLEDVDTSKPDAFGQQPRNPDRRDAFIRDALDAGGDDLNKADKYLQDLRNADAGRMRYDKDLCAAQHYVKGASGASKFGTTVQDLATDMYEFIKHVPGGKYVLSDPFNKPPPSPPDVYVWESARRGSAVAGARGVRGVRDDVRKED